MACEGPRARSSRKTAVAVLFVRIFALILLGIATPAAAHGATGTPASNYVAVIESVRPTTAGFSVTVIEATSRMEVRWRSGQAVVVLGYQDNPYLRVSGGGVEQNILASDVYINRTRLGGGDIPKSADDAAAPKWVKISTDPVARWHDHRVHWMAAAPPEGVQRNRNKHQTVQRFEVTVRQGGTDHIINGRLDWVPGPSPTPFVAGAVLVAVLLALLGAVATRRPGVDQFVIRLTILLLGLLVVADAIHLAGIAFGVRGRVGGGLSRMLSIGYGSLISWVAAGLAAFLVLRGRRDGLYLATFAAGLMLLVGGVTDFGVLSSTSVPFVFSSAVARWTIATTLGLGAGVVALGIQLTRVRASEVEQADQSE